MRMAENCRSWEKLMEATARVMRMIYARNEEGKMPKGIEGLMDFASDVEKPILAKEIEQVEGFWVKVSQEEMAVEMEKSRREKYDSKGKMKSRITGRYRRLAPQKDENGTWRIGSRLGSIVPFTNSGNLPILLPKDAV